MLKEVHCVSAAADTAILAPGLDPKSDSLQRLCFLSPSSSCFHLPPLFLFGSSFSSGLCLQLINNLPSVGLQWLGLRCHCSSGNPRWDENVSSVGREMVKSLDCWQFQFICLTSYLQDCVIICDTKRSLSDVGSKCAQLLSVLLL